MSTVLARADLERSPLADLHLLADELGVDGFRRLRKPELIDAIIARQGGTRDEGEAEAADEGDEARRGRRSRRGGRGRSRVRSADGDAETAPEPGVAEAPPAPLPEAAEAPPAPAPEAAEERTVEGVVELLANGSGFVRLSPPEPTDDDVYVSAAQVKRCELVSGDRIAGPVRAPRRSERYPSLVRVDRINDRPADEVAEGTRFEDLPVAFPEERFALDGDDDTLRALEWAVPFGRGSRVVVVGPPLSGKSELLRRLTAALRSVDGVEVIVALAGVRPEEAAEWGEDAAACLTLAAPPDAQAQAVEQAVEQGRRVAARGGDAVVVVDALAHLPAPAARRALAAARNLAGGGSLTVVAAAPAPVGGETTLIALDPELTAARRFPNLDLAASGVLHPERLVGEEGAEAIARARAEASDERRRAAG